MSSTAKFVIVFLSVINAINASNQMNFWNRFVDPRTSAVTSINSNFLDSCNQRQSPGFICMDCSILARCVFRNNGWDTIPLEVCDAGQNMFCHANEQRCSSNPGPCSPGAGQGGNNFACTGLGVFPNPFNCQSYHMCYASGLNLISVNVLCSGNYAFNPITNDCSLNLNNQICRGNQFTCNNVGDMGAWPLNPNIYYICMAQTNAVRVLFPTLYRCPVGQVFRAGNCVPPNGVEGPGGFKCTRAGLFPDPFNCRAYFHCDGLLRSQHISCPNGTYFNQFTLGCIRGSC